MDYVSETYQYRIYLDFVTLFNKKSPASTRNTSLHPLAAIALALILLISPVLTISASRVVWLLTGADQIVYEGSRLYRSVSLSGGRDDILAVCVLPSFMRFEIQYAFLDAYQL